MNCTAILSDILRRNALRREARLPLLDVRAEYEHAVATAHRCEVHERHYDVVRAEVVWRLRQERGPEWGNSAGGRWLIEANTAKELAARFRAEDVQPAATLGYSVLDCLNDPR